MYFWAQIASTVVGLATFILPLNVSGKSTFSTIAILTVLRLSGLILVFLPWILGE